MPFPYPNPNKRDCEVFEGRSSILLVLLVLDRQCDFILDVQYISLSTWECSSHSVISFKKAPF
jgi:hypothetical protein